MTVRLQRELQMVRISATRCSCIAILWVSLVSFAAITPCVPSQRVFIVLSAYFIIDSVRKLSDDRGSRVRFPAGLGIFLFTTASRTALRPTQPPIQWVPRALCLAVKRPGREADHSPSSAEIKEWVELYLHSPNMPSRRGAQLKHRDNFTFTLYLRWNYNISKVTRLSTVEISAEMFI
jgi:hypothetical protein